MHGVWYEEPPNGTEFPGSADRQASELEELFELSDYMQVLSEGRLSARFKTSETAPEARGRAMIDASEGAA